MPNDPTGTVRQLRRPHYIRAWMDKRGITAADLGRELDIDKSLISRWLSGSTPSVPHQIRLAAFFHCDQEAIFRHPDDDWLAKFFRNRSSDEIERIKATLEAAFPRNTGT